MLLCTIPHVSNDNLSLPIQVSRSVPYHIKIFQWYRAIIRSRFIQSGSLGLVNPHKAFIMDYPKVISLCGKISLLTFSNLLQLRLTILSVSLHSFPVLLFPPLPLCSFASNPHFVLRQAWLIKLAFCEGENKLTIFILNRLDISCLEGFDGYLSDVSGLV